MANYLPTSAQLGFIRVLCKRLQVPFPTLHSRLQAKEFIDKHVQIFKEQYENKIEIVGMSFRDLPEPPLPPKPSFDEIYKSIGV